MVIFSHPHNLPSGRAPDAEREFFRFFQPTERLALQGFDPEIILDFPNPKLAVKAAGNAYPVPLIIAAAHGIVQGIIENVNVIDALEANTEPLPLDDFTAALKADPRPAPVPVAIARKPKATAKAAAKRSAKAKKDSMAKAKSKAKAKGKAKAKASPKANSINFARYS